MADGDELGRLSREQRMRQRLDNDHESVADLLAGKGGTVVAVIVVAIVVMFAYLVVTGV